jgi:hypothetical protein
MDLLFTLEYIPLGSGGRWGVDVVGPSLQRKVVIIQHSYFVSCTGKKEKETSSPVRRLGLKMFGRAALPERKPIQAFRLQGNRWPGQVVAGEELFLLGLGT